jgi:diacylglycerol kinase family enzyme
VTAHILDSPGEIHAVLHRALEDGQRVFVAAGGDGTVQLLVQALLESVDTPGLSGVCLGAIGLGSSNDFHKPVRARIRGVPCKLDYLAARPRDVGLLVYEGEGIERSKFWLLNASIGMTAEANAFFNRPDPALSHLKRVSTPAAILYSTLRTFLTFGSWLIEMRDPDGVELIRIANLTAVKSPHCGGVFRYDSPTDLSSRSFQLHLCREISLPRLLYTIWRLATGRFHGLPWTKSRSVSQIQISAAVPFAIEFDGEVVFSRKASFSVHAHHLKVCP